jgi:hypothetical protein
MIIELVQCQTIAKIRNPKEEVVEVQINDLDVFFQQIVLFS